MRNDVPYPGFTRRGFIVGAGSLAIAQIAPAFGGEPAVIAPQPYFAGVKRAVAAMADLGAPLPAADVEQLMAWTQANDAAAVATAETLLARHTLAWFDIDAKGDGRVVPGGAPKVLVEQGWRMFLIRVANPAGRTDRINFSSHVGVFPATPGQMLPGFASSQRAWLADTLKKGPNIEKMWLWVQVHGASISPGSLWTMIPAVPLSGIPVEYHVAQLFSQDRGEHSADLMLTVLPKTFSVLPPYKTQRFDFHCLPSRDVGLSVIDTDGRGCVASLTIKDKLEHIYPPQAMRLAPDMFFQPQVYRADSESMRLPDGDYTVESWRGPEYLRGTQSVTIGEGQSRIGVKLQRWVDPARWGWYSGDTHIHASGCAHYEIPTEGVAPESMIRQVRGEGLAIGEILTWAMGRDYQKQFFTGHAESPAATLEHPELQSANNANLQPHATPEDAESLIRYDSEISGFPSSHSGHLVLMRLKEQDYPGTTQAEDWPSWNLPILQWAKAQGAVGGYAHCASGMVVESDDLPNYEIPPFDGVGANEAIVDITHGVVEFLSGCNVQANAELNAWYHLLNCGFRPAMVGETDYPCVTGERPGVGRTYVRLEHRPIGDAGYEAWVRNLQQGRLYCGDGRSHILEFTVQGRSSGAEDVVLASAGDVRIQALVAARLEPEVTPVTEAIRTAPGTGWHLEHARIGHSRDVAVELVVNGMAVDRVNILADGAPRPVRFKTPIARSSWVALRILTSVHTHPVFVHVAGRPIRASRRSARWCRTCVDKIWEVKSPMIRSSEIPAAAQAYDHARKVYDGILNESEVD